MADKVQRCAVYTRKSTEDGLEQEFNSLDAQYEACAAYALSQRHEGWELAPERYDDGGFSGGNMERPGLKRLLADIAAGRIDIVLLYKIDRLTRSLSDFSRIVDVLDGAGASFVSITQAFNTTTSMGRLTLNMLLSFAQFEREVTGERIRDKIAASKKKGIWMGGPVPLGYKVENRRLVVVPEEAEQVRHIMSRYCALGCVPVLVEELERDGYRTKLQRRASGPHRGSCAYRRGTLYHLLSNRIYRGMIVHKGKAYEGEHAAIVDVELWDKVQARLKANASGSARRRRIEQPSLLTGLVYDSEGRAMTPSHSGKSQKTRRYRYYVTRPDLLSGGTADRVSAQDLEQIVCEGLAAKIADPGLPLDLTRAGLPDAAILRQATAKADLAAATLRSGTAQDKLHCIRQLLSRAELQEQQVQLTLNSGGIARALNLSVSAHQADDPMTLTLPALRVRKGHQLRLVVPGIEKAPEPASKHDRKLIALVADALDARDLVLAHPDLSLATIAAKENRCRTRLTRLVALSCLSPDIIRLIAEGKQPGHLTAKHLLATKLPLSWSDQHAILLGPIAE